MRFVSCLPNDRETHMLSVGHSHGHDDGPSHAHGHEPGGCGDPHGCHAGHGHGHGHACVHHADHGSESGDDEASEGGEGGESSGTGGGSDGEELLFPEAFLPVLLQLLAAESGRGGVRVRDLRLPLAQVRQLSCRGGLMCFLEGGCAFASTLRFTFSRTNYPIPMPLCCHSCNCSWW